MCKRRDCLNNYCTKYYTSHKYGTWLTDFFWHNFPRLFTPIVVVVGRQCTIIYYDVLLRPPQAPLPPLLLFMTWAWALSMTGSWICMTRRRASTRRKSRHVRFRTRWRASTRAVRKLTLKNNVFHWTRAVRKHLKKLSTMQLQTIIVRSTDSEPCNMFGHPQFNN